MAQRIQVNFLRMAHEDLHNLVLVSLFSASLISYSLLSSQPYPQAPCEHTLPFQCHRTTSPLTPHTLLPLWLSYILWQGISSSLNNSQFSIIFSDPYSVLIIVVALTFNRFLRTSDEVDVYVSAYHVLPDKSHNPAPHSVFRG